MFADGMGQKVEPMGNKESQTECFGKAGNVERVYSGLDILCARLSLVIK